VLIGWERLYLDRLFGFRGNGFAFSEVSRSIEPIGHPVNYATGYPAKASSSTFAVSISFTG
jgi:hypothetical protein